VAAGKLRGLIVASSIAADVAAADSFWADNPKTLAGPPPEFGVSSFYRDGEYAREAVWPIADSLGIVTAAQLRFVVRPGLQLGPSVSVIFNRQAIARLDFVPPQECESNPIWAEPLGLPAMVCGPHFHGWEYNRPNVLSRERLALPCRESLPVQIRRFEQAFPDQRSFDVPAELV
jgi:hypothetical protein